MGDARIEFWTLGLLSVSSALLRFGKPVVLDCRGPRGAVLLPVDDPYASHRRVYGLECIVHLIIYLSNLASHFFTLSQFRSAFLWIRTNITTLYAMMIPDVSRAFLYFSSFPSL